MMEQYAFTENVPLKKVIASVYPEFESGSGFFKGLRIKLRETSKNVIYLLSTGEVVREFPAWLHQEGFLIESKDLPTFIGLIEKNISRYVHEISPKTNISSDFRIKKDVTLTVTASKHFQRIEGSNIGRYKLSMKFYRNDPDFGTYEEISIDFTKRDIYTLFYMIQKALTAQKRSKTFFVLAKRVDEETGEEIDELHIPVAKVYDSYVMGDVWLHGQEILNLFYVVDELTHNFFITERMEAINLMYRQITVLEEDGIAYLYLSKMDENNDRVLMKTADGRSFIYKIPFSPTMLGVLNATGSVEMLSHAEHGQFESESSNPFRTIDGLKYHISTKESFLGVGIQKGKVFIAGKIKESDYLDQAVAKDIVVLDNFIIRLRPEFVVKLLRAASIAYTGNLREWDRDVNLVKFYVRSSDMQGNVKYEFTLTTDIKNKVPFVLKIDKYRLSGSGEQLLASFRQPLFKRYVFQLINILLLTVKDLHKWKYTEKMNKTELLGYRYSSLKKVTKLIRSSEVDVGFEKIEDGKVYEGVLVSATGKEGKEKEELELSDRNMLSISSKHRLLHGEWIYFVGSKVAIGPDRYFTDMYSEFNLEKEFGSGESWAAGIFGAVS